MLKKKKKKKKEKEKKKKHIKSLVKKLFIRRFKKLQVCHTLLP